MIQTEIPDGKGGVEKLDKHDSRYWEGPYRYEPFPKAMYRQAQPGQAPETRVVQSQQERERLGSDWHESPADAKSAFDRLEADIAKAAAERAASDLRMSARAQAEALAIDRATDRMQPEIKERPKRKYVKKATVPSTH